VRTPQPDAAPVLALRAGNIQGAEVKTRVRKVFVVRLGRNVYHVEKWDHWDDFELRMYHPDAIDWRCITTVDNEQEARDIAYRASIEQPTDVVIAEYGE
jgi:hypothetical protein